MNKKDIVQSQCCECGTYGLCNQKTNLCLDCDKSFEIENRKDNNMNNDYQMERLLNELRDFTKEKERLILVATQMRDEYQDKINMYQEEILKKEQYTKDVIRSLIEIDKMKETKTQKTYDLVSAKIIITKDKYDMKLKKEFDENTIPDRFIETKKQIKWGDYKKILKIVDNNVVNIQTGEIIDNVEIKKVEGGQIKLKFTGC